MGEKSGNEVQRTDEPVGGVVRVDGLRNLALGVRADTKRLREAMKKAGERLVAAIRDHSKREWMRKIQTRRKWEVREWLKTNIKPLC
jgi:hypothetical protein